MRFLKKLKGKYLRYDSIENIPIGVWDKIHINNDLTLLAKNQEQKKFKTNVLVNAWEKINDEFLEEFGLPEEFERQLDLKRRAAEFQAKYIIEGKRHYLTHAEITLSEISNFSQRKKIKLGETLSLLMKHYQFKIDEKTTTVKEYFHLAKTITNGRKEN